MKYFSKDLCLGLCLALAASALINLPLLKAIVSEHEMSYPDIVFESSDEEFYLARIKEIGMHPLHPGNPTMFERRNESFPFGTLAEYPEGFFVALGLPLKTVSVAMDFAAPCLLILLLWIALRPLLPGKTDRFFVIGFLFLGSSLSFWKRPVSPQMTSLFLFGYLFLFLGPKRDTIAYGIMRAILIGLMVYTYPYHWTYCLAAEGLLFLLSRTPWKERLRSLLILAIPFLLTVAPYLLHAWSLRGNPEVSALLHRYGLIDTHWPSSPKNQLILLTVGTVLLWMWKRKTFAKEHILPLTSLIGAALIVLNQSVLTGKESEFSSHYAPVVMIPIIIGTIFLLSALLQRKRLRLITATIAALVLVSLTMSAEKEGFTAWASSVSAPAARVARGEMIDKLNSLPPDRVILTNQTLAETLMISTRHFPYFSSETWRYLATSEELLTRARTQRQLIPDEPLSSRTVLGAYALNLALQKTQVCRVLSLFRRSREQCRVDPETLLPGSWKALQTAPALSRGELLHTLRSAHVSFLLLPAIPPALKGDVEIADRLPDLLLLRLKETAR